MIVNITTAPEGGGAELLVRELHKLYLRSSLDSRVIYLSGSPSELGGYEEIIGANPRSPLNIFRIRKKLKLFIRQSRSDLVVHAHLTWPFIYVALASVGLSNLTLFYTEHDTNNKRRRIPFFRFLERFIYRRYCRVICISKGVYDSLSEWVGARLSAKLVTVKNGSRIYNLSKRLPFNNRKVHLVSVGSLTSKKNFSTAIQAVSKVPDIVETYIIVGEGSERKQLELLIDQKGLENQVKLMGWSNQIEKYLQRADIQLIPSLWEGFGLVAVEGMSTGLCVVASDVAGLREVLDARNPAVTLVEETESVDAWVQGLRIAVGRLRENSPAQLSVAARNQAEKFTLETMAERYIELYRSCCKF